MAMKHTRLEPEKSDEPELRMVLLGRTGAGKSASGNTILGNKAFTSISSPNSVTSQCQKETGLFAGQKLSVVDAPGLFDTNQTEEEMKTEISRSFCFSDPGPHVFLIVIQSSRFTKEEVKTVRIIQEMFGKEAARYTMALFTYGDNLNNDGVTIEEFITKNSALCDFIRQCKGGYHVFNNRDQDPTQVRELLKKINEMVQRNGGSCYTKDMFEEAERAARKAEADFRIVVVGKAGVGKSSAGNTILGGDVFKCKILECQKETAQFDFQTVAVVDTPDLFDTELTKAEKNKQLTRCFCFAAPGPHVLLIVIHPDKFTEEDKKETVKLIKDSFGKTSPDYTMALFTLGDELEKRKANIQELIDKNPALGDFIRQCGGGYHVFNNRKNDPSQVRELLEKINTMVQRNGGRYYSTKMFEDAEKTIEEEVKKIKDKHPNMTAKEARHRAERRNRFTWRKFSKLAARVRAVASAARVRAVASAGWVRAVASGARVRAVASGARVRAVASAGRVRAVASGAAVGTGVGIGIEFAVAGSVGAIGGPVGAAVGILVAGAAIGMTALLKKYLFKRR